MNTTSSLSPNLDCFYDESTECAICLEPLEKEDYDATTATTTSTAACTPTSTITLSCGHRWHLACLREQLELAKPSATRRLLFSGCQCAKCGTICEHPQLEDYTRATDALRHKVDDLLVEQLNNDVAGLSNKTKQEKDNGKSDGNDDDDDSKTKLLRSWQQVQRDNDLYSKEQVLKQARKKYAFYLCSHCHEPYFGGTVECSDNMVDEDESSPSSSSSSNETRLCMACTPQVVCRNPLEHLASIVWKCRFCCQPATHVCYGNVHFCDDCHRRNSQRVQRMQVWKHQERLARRGTSSRNEQTNSTPQPPLLTPIPCEGKDCPFPKPSLTSSSLSSFASNNGNSDAVLAAASATSSSSATAEFHSNGPTPECEQVYTCLICQSSAGQEQQNARKGSRNLLHNPSGALGLEGWKQLNPRRSWQVEDSEWPVNATTTTNFVSSFQPCIMCQVVDLSRALPGILREASQNDEDHNSIDDMPLFASQNFAVEVSARYQARTDCPSVFRLEAIAMDSNRLSLQRLQTAVLDAPPDHWAKAELTLEHLNLDEAKYIAIVVTGKDQRFWDGNFGSKVADCSVRVLWKQDTDRNTDNNEPNNHNDNDPAVEVRNEIAGGIRHRRMMMPEGGVQRDQQLANDDHRPVQLEPSKLWFLYDLALSLVWAAFLLWLVK